MDKTWLVPAAAVCVSILSVVVAHLQWKTAQSKVRFDSFDRQFAIYEATRDAINEALNGVEMKAFQIFCRQKKIARLVMPQVHKELDNISSVMTRLATARDDMKTYRSEADRLEALDRETQNKRQLLIQREAVTKLFTRHMRIG